MYRIVDSYGTDKVCWTWSEAILWLSACSPEAAIFGRWPGKLMAVRNQVRVY